MMKNMHVRNRDPYHKVMNASNIMSNVLCEHTCLENPKAYCETIFDKILTQGQYNMKSVKHMSSDNISDLDIAMLLVRSIKNRDAVSGITRLSNRIFTTGKTHTASNGMCKSITDGNGFCKSITTKNVIHKSRSNSNVICKSSSTINVIYKSETASTGILSVYYR